MDLQEIYAASAGRLVAQVYGVTGDFAEAQDVVQEAFARALAHPGRMRNVDNPEAWLRRVALNVARSRYRRRAVFDRLARGGRLHEPGHAPPLSPDHVALVAALQRLPRATRETVVLHHIADLPVAEVAAALGCSVDTVKSRLVRGRRALADSAHRQGVPSCPTLISPAWRQAARSAFKPHYADVVHRAGRRRRHARAAGRRRRRRGGRRRRRDRVDLLGRAGGGAASPGPNGATAPGDLPVPSHAPSPGSVPSPVVSWVGPGPAPTGEAPVERQAVMYAGDLDHLYSLLMGCAGCPARLAASEDGGATWRWHDLPVDGPMAIDVVAPRTLVMRADPELNNNPATMKWRTSTDGGATWQERSLRKVASVPAGWVATYLGDGVFAADPATGDFAMVTSSPVKIRPLMQNGLPASAGIWDSGYAKEGGDEVSMIANSRDGGATWQTYTFPDRVVAGFDNQEWGSLAIATADGQTVYAVGKLSGQLHVYRSTDGGGSWQRTAARAETGVGFLEAAALADGTLVIRLTEDDGVRLLRSTDQGESVSPADLGPGGRAQVMPGGDYENTDDGGLWLFTAGSGWRLVAPPKE